MSYPDDRTALGFGERSRPLELAGREGTIALRELGITMANIFLGIPDPPTVA